VRDKAAFRRGVKRLQALGHEVEVDRDALAVHTRFAGDDATRIAAIARAAASGADVALISRGGYGLTRILPGIDSAVARHRGRHGFVGISGSRLSSAAGPKPRRHLGRPRAGPDFGMPVGRHHGSPLRRLAPATARALAGMPKERRAAGAPEVPLPEFEVTSSTLWGGNLAVLCALVGTPYFPQVDGGILFVEDVNEHPYRVERMLTQLLHAGVLARQKALVLGQFSNYRLAPHDKGFKLQTVVDWLRSQ
jgi:muramoyltetrapeptide carboxypeptidase